MRENLSSMDFTGYVYTLMLLVFTGLGYFGLGIRV